LKFLKNGKKEVFEYIGECGKCGCIFKVSLDELSDITSGDYRNDFESYGYYDKCPEEFCDQNDIRCYRSDTKTAKRLSDKSFQNLPLNY